jgi:hypothetical protein
MVAGLTDIVGAVDGVAGVVQPQAHVPTITASVEPVGNPAPAKTADLLAALM